MIQTIYQTGQMGQMSYQSHSEEQKPPLVKDEETLKWEIEKKMKFTHTNKETKQKMERHVKNLEK